MSLPTTIPGVLAAAAERAPSSPALDAVGRPPLSFARLMAQMGGVAAALSQRGLGPGDTVALLTPNGAEAAAAFLAIGSAAVCAPLNPMYGRDELDFYLGDLSARALVIDAGLDSPARDVARGQGIAVIELAPAVDESAGLFLLDGELPALREPPSPDPNHVALVLHTSGTTSRPKMVPLTHLNLATSATGIARSLALQPEDRCLNVMPLFHIHGLLAATLASLAGGGTVICTPGFLAPSFFDWLDEFAPTWYTAVPSMHQSILARAPAREAAPVTTSLRCIRSSSAALPRPTLAELERVFGVPVIEAYGMTEAAHQMASNPLPPRERKPGSVGIAAGPEIAIMDEAGAVLATGQTGEVVVRGPSVTRGYARNASANAMAFVNGWFRTGDQGHLDADGYLFLTGRLKELINRGGEKVSPIEVDEALMEHPAVAQALAFSVPHPRLGEEVGAAIVLEPGMTATAAELRETVAARLAYFKIPRSIVFLDALPKGPTGKPQRLGLAERLGVGPAEPPPGGPAGVAPRTPVEEVLAGVWGDVMRRPPGGVHENFFDAGGDSMLAIRFTARVRELLGVELSLLIFFDGPSIAAIGDAVHSMLQAVT